MFRAFALILFGIAAGAVGFQAGLATAAANGTGTIVVMGGFPGIGTVLFLFLLAAIAFGMAGRRRHWAGGHGGWGPMGPMGGRWGGPSDPNDPRRQWVAEMHRKLHESDAAGGTTTGTGSNAGSGPTPNPAA